MSRQTITALFDSRSDASDAALRLRQAGIPDGDVVLSPETGTLGVVEETDRPATGFWASLENMFGGTNDHQTYSEGLRRGGTMITAHVDDGHVDDAIAILEEHGSVDLNERETTWRGEGWTGGTASSASLQTAPIASGNYVAETDVTSGIKTGASQRGSTGEDVVQIVEEQLNVGKRSVNRGKVRLHTYVVETPVSEDVSLRNETVSIERRPVDRVLGSTNLGADAFQDRTIEMDEMAEEAVVGKSTRVIEEIGIRKAVTNRVETINDSVRSTKVDIEDDRTTATSAVIGSSSTVNGAGALGVVGTATAKLAKDMEVVGSDGQHVGVIDHVDGSTIKLKKNDPASGGQHHLIPADWVVSVGDRVLLNLTAVDARARWTAA